MITSLIKGVLFMTFTLLLTYLGSASLASAEINLIANPGFESGATVPLNWTLVTSNGNTPIWDSVIHHNGSRSIKISNPTSMISGYPKSYLIKVKPLQYYSLSAWGKTQNVLSNSHAVRIVELDINKNWLSQRNLNFNKGTNDWTQNQIDFQTGSNAAYVYIYANIWKSAGTFWVDDIKLILSVPATSPRTYYVAKNGNDNNPGTEVSPLLTIQKAANKAVAGDKVYIKAGTYSEQVIFPNSGTAGKYITFQNYSKDIVTVKAPIKAYSTKSHKGHFQIIGKSYIKIKGFKFTTSGAGARVCGGGNCSTPFGSVVAQSGVHDIIIDGNVFYDIDRSAIVAGYDKAGNYYGAWNITVTNNYFYRPTSWTWNELLSFDSVNRPNVSYNKIAYQGNGECIDYKSGTDNGIISHNIVSNCWHPVNGVPTKWVGIYIDAYDEGVSKNRIFSNIVSKTSGIIAGSERGGLAQNNLFYNNIMYDNILGTGLSAYSESGYVVNYKNNVFINNVAYNNNVNYYAKINGIGNIFRNNIGWNGTIQINPGHTQDHNLFGTDPQFVNPAALNFHLKTTSPAINVGSSDKAPITDFDGDSRPKGGGYDLGSFEDY